MGKARGIRDPVDFALLTQIVDHEYGRPKRCCSGMFLGASRWKWISSRFAHLREPK